MPRYRHLPYRHLCVLPFLRSGFSACLRSHRTTVACLYWFSPAPPFLLTVSARWICCVACLRLPPACRFLPAALVSACLPLPLLPGSPGFCWMPASQTGQHLCWITCRSAVHLNMPACYTWFSALRFACCHLPPADSAYYMPFSHHAPLEQVCFLSTNRSFSLFCLVCRFLCLPPFPPLPAWCRACLCLRLQWMRWVRCRACRTRRYCCVHCAAPATCLEFSAPRFACIPFCRSAVSIPAFVSGAFSPLPASSAAARALVCVTWVFCHCLPGSGVQCWMQVLPAVSFLCCIFSYCRYHRSAASPAAFLMPACFVLPASTILRWRFSPFSFSVDFCVRFLPYLPF